MNHCKTDLGIQNRPLHAEFCQSSARAWSRKSLARTWSGLDTGFRKKPALGLDPRDHAPTI